MKISKRIKELREEYGVTQASLAKALGHGKTTISNYENGVSIPDLGAAMTIAKFFHCSLDYLTGLTDNRFRDSQKDRISLNYSILKAYKVAGSEICYDEPAIIYISEKDIRGGEGAFVLIDENEKLYLVGQKESFIHGDNVVVVQDGIHTGKLCKEDDELYFYLYSGKRIKIKDTRNIKGILLKSF